jgi:hypothetical protein
MQREDGVIRGQKDGVPASPRHVFHLWIGLSLIRFEGQRERSEIAARSAGLLRAGPRRTCCELRNRCPLMAKMRQSAESQHSHAERGDDPHRRFPHG